MNDTTLGIIHPGAMGISVAATARKSGYDVYWVPEGRSAATVERARSQDLLEAQSLADLCTHCAAIICICPPHAAEDVAEQVAACNFSGLYIDANAIAPQRAQRIAQCMDKSGAAFVDGGIIGGPAWEPGHTWLCLSGPDADRAAAMFAAGPLETELVGVETGKASALKMCYAAYTKGSTALLSAILGASESLGVREDLQRFWARDDADFPDRAIRRATRVTAKAWRYAGEMEEIAATFASTGLPDGFHIAAAEIYRRIAHFKDDAENVTFDAVLQALQERRDAEL